MAARAIVLSLERIVSILLRCQIASSASSPKS